MLPENAGYKLSHFEAIGEEPIVKETVGYEEKYPSVGEVEELTKDETTKVNVVLVVNVSAEELDQLFSFFVLILYKSCCCSFSEQLH